MIHSPDSDGRENSRETWEQCIFAIKEWEMQGHTSCHDPGNNSRLFWCPFWARLWWVGEGQGGHSQ